jgi:hypothetical protein
MCGPWLRVWTSCRSILRSIRSAPASSRRLKPLLQHHEVCLRGLPSVLRPASHCARGCPSPRPPPRSFLAERGRTATANGVALRAGASPPAPLPQTARERGEFDCASAGFGARGTPPPARLGSPPPQKTLGEVGVGNGFARYDKRLTAPAGVPHPPAPSPRKLREERGRTSIALRQVPTAPRWASWRGCSTASSGSAPTSRAVCGRGWRA